MPDKIISDAILTSGSWRRLSADARAIFAPLLPSTDPWGRRTADIDGLLTLADGLGWSDARLLSALEEYVREGMIELYCHQGDWYLQVVNHDRHNRQRIRLRKGQSRYPPPPVSDERTTSVRRSLEVISLLARARGRVSGGPFGTEPTAERRSSLSSSSVVDVVQSRFALNESRSRNGDPAKGTLAWFVTQFSDGDARKTPAAIRSTVEKWSLPEAALWCALEEVQAGGAEIRSPAACFVAKLDEYGRTGRYAA